MRVGLLMVFQNFMNTITDREAYERDLHLASLAEPLGFDTIGGVEHHFFNYAMAPDPTQFLSYMAAKTSRIQLLTGADNTPPATWGLVRPSVMLPPAAAPMARRPISCVGFPPNQG